MIQTVFINANSHHPLKPQQTTRQVTGLRTHTFTPAVTQNNPSPDPMMLAMDRSDMCPEIAVNQVGQK